MRLAARTWGTGPSVAVLVHGYTDDSATWWWVGPALAERGFLVVAPDLRGHGSSPRAASYEIEHFAMDLAEGLPREPDLAVGHSLGALALSVAMADLRPRTAVLVDPPWLQQPGELPTGPITYDDVRAVAPLWSDEDVRVDATSTARMDPAVTAGLTIELRRGPVALPAAVGDTHVVVPGGQALLPPAAVEALPALGYRLHVVPGSGHVVHRDAPDAFLDVLDAVLTGVPA